MCSMSVCLVVWFLFLAGSHWPEDGGNYLHKKYIEIWYFIIYRSMIFHFQVTCSSWVAWQTSCIFSLEISSFTLDYVYMSLVFQCTCLKCCVKHFQAEMNRVLLLLLPPSWIPYHSTTPSGIVQQDHLWYSNFCFLTIVNKCWAFTIFFGLRFLL